MSAPPVISSRGLSFSYDREPVLEHVDFSIAERDLVCMVGPNGGGKTTLLRLMTGLLRPDGGVIEVFGTTPERSRHRIGYMPQHARLDPAFPAGVLDIVLMGRLGHGRGFGPYSSNDKQVALRTLDEVGLGDKRGASFGALSGGERQRVLVARALACEPDILLLDEPMANLDPVIQDNLYALFRQLNQRLTIIVVSHDIVFVAETFKTVVCVNRNVHMHPADELTAQRVAEVYGRRVRMVHHNHDHGPGAAS